MKYEQMTWYWLTTRDGGFPMPVFFNSEGQFKLERGCYLGVKDFTETFLGELGRLDKAIMPTDIGLVI